MLFITELIAHFHPVLVHLPIGILLLAILFHWLSTKEKFAGLSIAIPIAYLSGAITAVLSCITGYLLSGSGEYDETTLNLHQWMGILVAFVSATGYLFSRTNNNQQLKWVSIALVVLLTVTGHLGGTLTHGEGYLWKGISESKKDSVTATKVIANAQEAIVYKDIIQPMLQQKCYNCHAATKQKGGLRLDAEEWIVKGGKNGKVLVAGSIDSSEMYKRIILDPVEEKHMPPKGKSQLTEHERVLLQWWIASGADFSKKSKNLSQTAAIKTALTALEKSEVVVTKRADIPDAEVAKANETILESLRKNSVTVFEISANSNWLSANYVNCTKWNTDIEKNMSSLKNQMVWLKIPGAQLQESSWKTVGGLNNLRRLSAEHSNITDKDLALLSALNQLQYLNLVDTKITAKGLMQLKGNTNLTNIYISRTGIGLQDYNTIKTNFPKAVIDT
ncbi:MAG: c-type cytochrome domain-containing protein, partial [Bacteroidota bacterium]